MFRNDQLIIFEGDWTDRSLPKHTTKRPTFQIRDPSGIHDESEEDASYSLGPPRLIMSNSMARSLGGSRVDWRDLQHAERLENDREEIMYSRWPLWWTQFRLWVGNLFQKRPEAVPPTMTIDEAFRQIVTSASMVTNVNAAERIEALQTIIDGAVEVGQTALVTQARRHMEAILAETALLQVDLGQYVTETDLITFVRASPRGLLLSFLNEFPRAIPADIRERKRRCDALSIFDAYVVLHHDPDRKSWADEDAAVRADTESRRRATEAQQAARTARDPILFGLIRGRRNLYLVGDWIDEVCDLQFGEIVTRLGAARAITTTPVLET